MPYALPSQRLVVLPDLPATTSVEPFQTTPDVEPLPRLTVPYCADQILALELCVNDTTAPSEVIPVDLPAPRFQNCAADAAPVPRTKSTATMNANHLISFLLCDLGGAGRTAHLLIRTQCATATRICQGTFTNSKQTGTPARPLPCRMRALMRLQLTVFNADNGRGLADVERNEAVRIVSQAVTEPAGSYFEYCRAARKGSPGIAQ